MPCLMKSVNNSLQNQFSIYNNYIHSDKGASTSHVGQSSCYSLKLELCLVVGSDNLY